MVRPGAELPGHYTRGDGWDELVQVLLQVQGLVLQQGLHHPHQVDQDGQVVLHHVHTHTLGDEGRQSKEITFSFKDYAKCRRKNT